MASNEITVFPLKKVQLLRRRAQRAAKVLDDGAEGWSRSDVDPMDLLSVFSSLNLKKGFVLRAYQFRSGGGNGNGIIWAMPEDSEFPKPAKCTALEEVFLEPPKPPKALDNFMDAIKGDGTPWSYLSASLFAREASEFGALWHGCSWSVHKIPGKDPLSPPHQPRKKGRTSGSTTSGTPSPLYCSSRASPCTTSKSRWACLHSDHGGYLWPYSTGVEPEGGESAG